MARTYSRHNGASERPQGLVLYRGLAAKFKASTQSSHVVANVGKIIFCSKCGSYAERRWRGLAKSCARVVPAHAAQARAQLLRGHHPRLNVFIALPTAARDLNFSARRVTNSNEVLSAAPCAYSPLIEEFSLQLSASLVCDEPLADTAPALSAAAAVADTGHTAAGKRRLCAKTSPADV